MASEVNENQVLPREVFVDIGSNIGSCAVHMASLGFPVIAVEPVQQHVNTIKGTMELNPSFHIDLHHGGISSVERIVKVNFGHGGTSAKRLGQKTMKIKKSNPARRKSFRARHNCDNPGPKTKARYWSCRAW
jgi:FkbM family methyltransferase